MARKFGAVGVWACRRCGAACVELRKTVDSVRKESMDDASGEGAIAGDTFKE